MKNLASRIQRELEAREAEHYAAYEDELQRIWPLNEKTFLQLGSDHWGFLLNEFLKEHKTVQDLKTTVAEQKKQIDALTAGLEKVSAQLEVRKPATRVAVSNK